MSNENVISSYRQGLYARLRRQPFLHRLRMLLFALRRGLSRLRWRLQQRRAGDSLLSRMVIVDSSLQPPPYRYGHLRGPWIESYFYEWFLRRQESVAATYLPILFDPIYFNSQSQKYTPAVFSTTLELLEHTLASLDPKRAYFTILGMYDFQIWNWPSFPRNVVVFSAAGWGDIAIPLLPGHCPYETGPKDIHLSFMGSLSGPSDLNSVRSRMFEALKDIAYFGKGSNWKKIMRRSTFSLCPRGQARTSFRLFEALSVGSIPIYLWDDREWLPYQDELDWSEFSISLPIDRVSELPTLLNDLPAEKIHMMQHRIENLYPQYFTLEATCRWISATADRFATSDQVRALTRNREV